MTVSSTDRLQEARAFRVEIGRGTWTDINLIKALMHLDAALGEVSRLSAELQQERARLDWLERFVHDEAAGTIGDLTFYGSFRGVSIEDGPLAPNVRAAIDAEMSTTPAVLTGETPDDRQNR